MLRPPTERLNSSPVCQEAPASERRPLHPSLLDKLCRKFDPLTHCLATDGGQPRVGPKDVTVSLTKLTPDF